MPDIMLKRWALHHAIVPFSPQTLPTGTSIRSPWLR